MAIVTSYITTVENTTSGTSFTFTSANIGTAASDRIVIVGFYYAGTSVTVSSATIQGITANIRANVTEATNARNTAIISASVPTGTTGDIVINVSGTSSRCKIQIYTVTGATAFDDAQTTSTVTSSAFSVSLTTTAGGGAIGQACGAVTVGAPCTTWTGITTEDIDAQFAFGSIAVTSAHLDSLSGGALTVKADMTAGAPVSSGTMCAVSYSATAADVLMAQGIC